MERVFRALGMLGLAAVIVVLSWVGLAAAELQLPPGYQKVTQGANAGGDFDYLPDGDIVGISYNASAPKLYRYDFNGDGFPALPQILMTLPTGAYGSIVKSSPDGSFLLVGFNGADNSLIKISLADYSVENLVTVVGNYDAAFIDNSSVYISANQGGWDSTKPNEILLLDLAAPTGMKVVAEIADTPSGAIALNSLGDLYYIKSTWAYPAPAGSYLMLKFSAAQLSAAVNGAALTAADSSVRVPFDSGADIEIILVDDGANDIFVSSFSGTIHRLREPALEPELFVSHDAEGEVGSFVKLAMYQPEEMFLPNHGFRSKLAVSYATSYFAVHEVVEISPNAGDKVHERLEQRACVGVNGFLEQINIVSVINKLSSSLPIKVSYYDLSGVVQGSVQSTVGARLKTDIIVNELGLGQDTYGTVCVVADGPAGSWSGGVALYKPDQRMGSSVFGDGFDFALYYPFSNPKLSRTTVPLNTYHLGTDSRDSVANWIAISDGEADGAKLTGTLFFYDASGNVVHEENVAIPDGGRRDFAGHLELSRGLNVDAIGMAEFVPEDSGQGYYLTVTRYFYDCQGLACNNFLTAFAVPDRPGTASEIAGGVNTSNGLISVVELNNTDQGTSTVDVAIYDAAGVEKGTPRTAVPERGTRHIIVNASGDLGYLAADNDGSSTVQAEVGAVSALHMMYRLDETGVLEEAFAAPLVASPGASQVTQFNTFIQHQNTTEVCNVTDKSRDVTISYVDVDGSEVHQELLALEAWETKRFVVPVLPRNTFGSILVEADAEGIVLRNYVARPGQYTLAFGAE